MTAELDAAARGERRRARTRAKVLDAAESLLAEASWSTVRVEDVAARSGISAASIYVHFGTKDGLIAAVLDRLLTDCVQRLRGAYRSEGTAFEQFQETGRAYLDLVIDHPALAHYIASDTADAVTSELERRVAEGFEMLRQEFEERIAQACADGQIRDVDPRRLSYFLLGAWNGVASLRLHRDVLALTDAEVRSTILEASDVIVRGLLPDRPGVNDARR